MKTQIIHWTTIVTDLILINLAFLMAYVARYVWQWFRPVLFLEPYRDYLGQQLVLTVLLALTFRYMGVWRRRRGELWLDEVARIVTATAAGVMLAMAVTFFLQPSPFSRLLIFWALLFIVLFLSVARLVRPWSLSVLSRRGVGVGCRTLRAQGRRWAADPCRRRAGRRAQAHRRVSRSAHSDAWWAAPSARDGFPFCSETLPSRGADAPAARAVPPSRIKGKLWRTPFLRASSGKPTLDPPHPLTTSATAASGAPPAGARTPTR